MSSATGTIYKNKFKSKHSHGTDALLTKLHHFCNRSSPDPIYPTPPLGQDMTQGQFFKRSLAGLNSEFSFS